MRTNFIVTIIFTLGVAACGGMEGEDVGSYDELGVADESSNEDALVIGGRRTSPPTRPVAASVIIHGTRDVADDAAEANCAEAKARSGLSNCTPVVVNVSTGSDPSDADDDWSISCNCA